MTVIALIVSFLVLMNGYHHCAELYSESKLKGIAAYILWTDLCIIFFMGLTSI